ncbi:hypothetical protein ACQWV3_000551 [Cronobacter malonaticus]|uniref:hypothetical protein n=1 Tax=Cronobacter malonaticus TaxID=413503 RepID=UPI000D009918|nr:hypothetical protein [Cronobacter malonaticus]
MKTEGMQNNDELIAAGHELAKCLDSNTPLLDIEKMIVRLADKLDVTTAALRERAEPVAVLDIQSGRQDGNKFALVFTRAAHTLPDDVYNLYSAPPAPVVTVETFEEWSRRCEIQLTLCRPEFREVAEITWNACRAAMSAAPGKDG